MRLRRAEQSPRDEILGDRLIARDLPQLAAAEVVIAAVAHLDDVEPRPDDDSQRQRRRVGRPVVLRRGVGSDRFVCLERRRGQRIEKLAVARRADAVIAPQRRRDVPRHRLRRHAARALPRHAAAHAVGDEQDRRHALAAQRQTLRRRQARAVDDDLGMHRRQEKMVLIFGADQARVRHAEQVELVVARLHAGDASACCRKQCGETHAREE
jgi:hypothetical protein